MAITYPLILPNSPGPRVAEWMPISAVGAYASPFTFHQQVQVHQGQLWQIKLAYPPMTELVAAQWIGKLLSLNGRQGTFLLGDSIRKLPYGSALATAMPLVNGANQIGQSLITDGWPPSVNGLLVGGADWIQLGGSTGLTGTQFTGMPSWQTDIYIISQDSSGTVIGFSDPAPSGGGTLHWSTETSKGIQGVFGGATEVTIPIGVSSSATARLHKVLNDVNSDSAGNATIDIWPRLRESPANNAPLILNNCKGTFRLKDNLMDYSIDVAKQYGLELEAVEAL